MAQAGPAATGSGSSSGGSSSGSGRSSTGSNSSSGAGARAASDDGAAARARADARAVFERAAARRALDRSGTRSRPAAAGDATSAGGAATPVSAAAATGTGPPAGAPGDSPEPVEPTRGLLLIGPGAGFGTHLLARFAREGFVLATISRSAETVARVVSELADQGVAVHCAVADVTDAEAFTAAVARLAAETGGLTVVVYNAKLSIRGTALTVAAQTLNQTLAVNVTGAVTTVQAALPLLVDRPGATVIFTTAGTRTSDSGGRFALALGKAGLATLGAAVAPQAASRGVRLRSVAIEDRVAPDGPLAPESVAEQFWTAFVAPRGSVFRLTHTDGVPGRDQLPLDV